MVSITDHVPPHCYFIRLHLGPVPGPSEWSASLTRHGRVAYIENARGDMHATSVAAANEFRQVLRDLIRGMGFVTIAWVRWTPDGFKTRRFRL